MQVTPANDNVPTKLAEQLTALLEFRNRPDSPPDPLQSSWTTDPSQVVIEKAIEDDGEPAVKFEEDLLLEITPSIRQIVREVEKGEVTYGTPRGGEKRSPVVGIGKLKFSDGEDHERAYKRGIDGEVVAYMRKMPAGAMLGATEKTGAAHGSSSPNVVTISNTNITHRLQPVTGKRIVARGYTPAVRKRRKGRSISPDQSRTLIAEAIANTPVLPPVTVCPPGIASGTARYSDQFIGMKVGSTGKGGAPNWVDFYMAGRDHEEWMETIGEVEGKHAAVLNAALSARTLQEVGVAAGQSAKYAAYNGGGKRALIAANDNLSAAIKKKSA
jgi:hypothetical protein